MNLQELLDYLNFVINKEQSGNSLKPKNYNTLLYVSNIEYFNKKFGLPEEYRPGHPFPSQAWETTQNMTDSLRKFKVKLGYDNTPLVISSNGKADIPANYAHYSSLRYNLAINENCDSTISMRSIDILTDAQWADRVGSSINPPSYEYPICMFQNNYIQFLPLDLKFVEFTYLRFPETPSYIYTVDSYDNIVYDAINSIQLEWEDNDIMNIAKLILSKIGINLRETSIVNYAEMQKQMG